MEQTTSNQEDSFNIIVKGPKGEVVSLTASSFDSATSLRERLLSYYSLAPYSCYHFEVDMKPGRKQIDSVAEFGSYDFIKDGTVFYLVCDQYNTLAAREHIKQTIASVSGNLPLIGLLLKKQDDELPESLVTFYKLASEAKKDAPLDLSSQLKECYFDKETIEKDQSLKSEISKPTFPVMFNPESFNATQSLLSEKKQQPLQSFMMSAYNPPCSNRQLVGDLLYVRVMTNENEILHVTCSMSGFFVNESTDSDFNASVSTKFPAIYPTLIHLFIAVSPCFADWYAKRVQEGDQMEKIRLEDILSTLRPMPSSNVASNTWFGTPRSAADIHDLFTHAETILEEEEIPYLSADVQAHREWLTEYVGANTLTDDENMALFYAISKENEFAETAKRGVMKIVDESVAPLLLDTSKDTYLVDDITFTRVPIDKEGGVSRAMANYQVLSASQINSAHVKNLYTPLVAVVDYKGNRFLAQTPVPGLMERPTVSLLLSGSVDGCATLYNDERVKPQLTELAEKLHWEESPLHVRGTEATTTEESAMAAPAVSKPVEVKEGTPVTFLGPADGKLLRGVDGNVYAVDFLRSQPVDTYWIQEEVKRGSQSSIQALLRPELVEQLLLRRAESEARAKAIREILEKREKGEKTEGLTDEQCEELKKQAALLEESVKVVPTKFDVNVFTPYSATTLAAQTDDNANTDHESGVLMLGNFLVGQVIPTLHEQLLSLPLNNQDGSKLVQLLHSSGVNVRYLGLLAGLCFNKSLAETPRVDLQILRACETEMIARAAKHYLNYLLVDPVLAAAPGYAVAAVLNALMEVTPDTDIALEGVRKTRKGKTAPKVPAAIARVLAENGVSGVGVWNSIRAMVDRHFHYKLRVWSETPDKEYGPAQCDRVVLLRRICIMLGVRLQARSYDMEAVSVFTPNDIEAFSPRVKHVHTSLLDDTLMTIFSEAAACLQQGELTAAFVYCRQVVMTAVSACHLLHPLIPRALTTMSTVAFVLKDYVTAVKYGRLALSCSDRVFGPDSIEVAICHTQLSDALRRAGGLHESIMHYKAALDIYLMACGDHSEEIGDVYASLGLLYKELVFNDKAVACLEIALQKLNKQHPDYEKVIQGLTQSYSLMGNWTNALKYEQMVLEMLKNKETKDEKAIEESEKRVKEYNTKMMMQMSMRKDISMLTGLHYVVLFSAILLLSCCIHYIEKGVLVRNKSDEQRSMSKQRDGQQYDIEDQYHKFGLLLEECRRDVPPQYWVEGEEQDQVQLLMQHGRPYHYRKSKLRTYYNIPFGYPFEVLQEPLFDDMKPYMFLTLMLSQACDFRLRSLVRNQTQHLRTRFSVYSIFVLGNAIPSCNDAIADENTVYGDILQFNHIDSYNNITLSVLFAFHYIHNLSLPIRYVFKTDSDCVVNYPRLVELINTMSENQKENLYMGLCDKAKHYNTYDVSRKNFVPKSLVQDDSYIPYYVTGGGYVISYELLPKLLVGISHLPFIGHNEDVNVGRGMKMVNIPCTDVSTMWISRNGCFSKEECLKRVIMHPWMDVSEVPRFYSYLLESSVCNKQSIGNRLRILNR